MIQIKIVELSPHKNLEKILLVQTKHTIVSDHFTKNKICIKKVLCCVFNGKKYVEKQIFNNFVEKKNNIFAYELVITLFIDG